MSYRLIDVYSNLCWSDWSNFLEMPYLFTTFSEHTKQTQYCSYNKLKIKVCLSQFFTGQISWNQDIAALNFLKLWNFLKSCIPELEVTLLSMRWYKYILYTCLQTCNLLNAICTGSLFSFEGILRFEVLRGVGLEKTKHIVSFNIHVDIISS